MRFLSKLFGNIGLDVNNLVDNIVTTDEERKSLKNKLKQILAQAEGSAQEQVTRRWEADSKAGWLPANIQQDILIFLAVYLFICIFIYLFCSQIFNLYFLLELLFYDTLRISKPKSNSVCLKYLFNCLNEIQYIFIYNFIHTYKKSKT